MGTLYLDRRNLTLRLDGQRLVIEEPDARPRGTPLALVERALKAKTMQKTQAVDEVVAACEGLAA